MLMMVCVKHDMKLVESDALKTCIILQIKYLGWRKRDDCVLLSSTYFSVVLYGLSSCYLCRLRHVIATPLLTYWLTM